MTARFRAGIIGAGFMGTVHAHAVRAAGGVVSRVAGRTREEAERAAARLLAVDVAASVDELVTADDVDAVHVCTPNHTHVALAEAALRAGKHVVCEKPLATSPEDARRLVEAATQAGVVAAVPFVYRFYPAVREARARIADGEAGPLWLLHGSYLQDWLARADATNWRVDPALGGGSRRSATSGCTGAT
jgi:predicted dehydrogenase